jgi:ABC-type nitrate/sulfonate/bicarbonate transport system permease component
MKEAFVIGGVLGKKSSLLVEILGLLLIIISWMIITYPVKETNLTFSTINGTNPKYTWSNDLGFEQDFPGDNTLLKVETTKYKFVYTDDNNVSFKGEILVPDTLTTSSYEQNFSIGLNKDSMNVEVLVNVKSKLDGFLVSSGTIPYPPKILRAFVELFKEDKLISNSAYSLYINILGYVTAIVLSIIFGYLIGLVPFFNALLSRWVNAIRFVPLNAVTGLFIVWFGMKTNMKIQFLAFGIIVYLLPVVVQRIKEVEKIYLQTAFTLGASKWQQIRYVYWPHVASRLIDDVRVLTAISWTYIIIAELLNRTAGIGSLLFEAQRFSRIDKLFALLLLIIIIGIVQDFIFVMLDKFLFPFKKVQNQK